MAKIETQFEKDLNTQHKSGEKRLKAIASDRFDPFFSISDNKAKHAKNNLEISFQQKAVELRSFARMQLDTLKKQGDAREGVAEQAILARHQITMNTMLQRYELVFDMAQTHDSDREVSTPFDIEAFEQAFDKTVRKLDIALLWYGDFLKPETDLVQKLIGKRQPDETDWSLLLRQVDHMLDPNGKEPGKTGMAINLLGALTLPQRYELMTRMTGEQVQNILTTWIGTGYIKRNQAIDILEQKKDEIPGSKMLLDKIMGKEMDDLLKSAAKYREDRRKHPRQSGHTNLARSLLTFKGIGSMLLVANGALTVGINAASHITDPATMIQNPMLWLGVAEVAAGLEMTNGFGGILPTMRDIPGLLTDKNEKKADKATARQNEFRTELLNSPIELKFYKENIVNIVSVYRTKKAKNPLTKADITFEDLGINYETLSDDYKRHTQGHYEEIITEWISRFSRTNSDGLGCFDHHQQEEFIKATEDASKPEPK